MPVKAIFFDLDDTLLDDNPSYDLSISRVCAELLTAMPGISWEPLFEAYRTLSSAYWAEVSGDVLSGVLDGQAVRLES